MQLKQWLETNNTGTPAELLAGYLVDPANYTTQIKAFSVGSWLGGNARRRRLDTFINADFISDNKWPNAAYVTLMTLLGQQGLSVATLEPEQQGLAIGLQSAAEQLIAMENNTDAHITVEPGGEHYQAVMGFVSFGVFSQEEAQQLIARGRSEDFEADATVENVEAELARQAEEAAAKARADAIQPILDATQHAQAAAVVLLESNDNSSWAEARAAMLAEFDSRLPQE